MDRKKNHQTAQLCHEWKIAMNAQALSQRTITERLRITARICDDCDTTPLNIGTDQIIEWIAGQPSAETKWTYFTHLRALFSWLEITGKRHHNPLLGMRAPKRPKYRPRPLAVEHIETVLEAPLRRSTRAMILLAFNCGLRVSEIAKVRGQDFDLVARELTVEGKGGQLALLPLNESLIPFFRTMPQRGYWFPGLKRGHIKPASAGKTIKTAFARHGITMTAHQLRHSYGTELLRNGADIRVVQELLRHESIQTTALYTRVAHDQEDEATNLLPVFKPNRKDSDAESL